MAKGNWTEEDLLLRLYPRSRKLKMWPASGRIAQEGSWKFGTSHPPPSTGYMTSRPRNCYPSLLGVEANLQFTSLPCAQDTGGENPCIGTKNGLKLLIVGDSAVRLLVTLGA